MSVGTTALELVGFAAVTFGVSQVYVPAGWVVGGGFAVLIGWLVGRRT